MDEIIVALRSLYMERHPGLTPIVDGQLHLNELLHHADIISKINAFATRYLFIGAGNVPFALMNTQHDNEVEFKSS
jgi:hypothetical protein